MEMNVLSGSLSDIGGHSELAQTVLTQRPRPTTANVNRMNWAWRDITLWLSQTAWRLYTEVDHKQVGNCDFELAKAGAFDFPA